MAATKKKRRYTEQANMIRAIRHAGLADVEYKIHDFKIGAKPFMEPHFQVDDLNQVQAVKSLGFKAFIKREKDPLYDSVA